MTLMHYLCKVLADKLPEVLDFSKDLTNLEPASKILREFLHLAEAEVRSLASLYSGVGRNVDALILYFGEDPAPCPFEQAISTLLNFQRMFNKSHEENCKQVELEMKKASENDKSKMVASNKQADHLLQAAI
ncbi:hypothetical protein SAY87_017419 [Trapa incisa]|uniref:FH2 domain-containing protein n=1 Tax=Trapa incisa TaxID=236973 RepID=A0AAN7LE37_9MYRT|nr:hypothetical protein SAY87_017419 [Trapa incisa]